MSLYFNGNLLSGVAPRPIELTQAEYDLLPEIEKQNGCYIITDGESEPFTAENVSYDNTDSGLVATDVQAAIDELAEGGGGGGGHTIVDDAGTSMTQRSDLQFNGVYTSDNSTDNTTEVNIVREMTESQYSQLTDAEKKGIIVTDASTPSVIGLTGDMVMYDATNTVNDIIDEIRIKKQITYSFNNCIFVGHNSGSGNYVSFFIPCNYDSTITNVSVANISNFSIYTPNEQITQTAIDFTEQTVNKTPLGLQIELKYSATKTANIPVSVRFGSSEIVFL